MKFSNLNFSIEKEEKTLSIIIPVFNKWHFTKNCINDLLKLNNKHEIIIVDNNSTDETEAEVNKLLNQKKLNSPSLVYIKNFENLGFAGGNNKGYKDSCGKNILFLNNDIRVKSNFENWTDEIIKYCEEGYLVAANGGLLDNNFSFIRETDDLIDNPYFYLSGWCLAASKETFNKLIPNYYRFNGEIHEGKAWGPWSEKFYPGYFEDDDLSFRAKKLNIPLMVKKQPLVHFGRVTSKSMNLSEMYLKNKEIFTQIWKDNV